MTPAALRKTGKLSRRPLVRTEVKFEQRYEKRRGSLGKPFRAKALREAAPPNYWPNLSSQINQGCKPISFTVNVTCWQAVILCCLLRMLLVQSGPQG